MHNFHDANFKTFSPMVLGDIVKIIDSNDSVKPMGFIICNIGFRPFIMTVSEFLARYLNCAYECCKTVPAGPAQASIKRTIIYNYMIGILEVLVRLNYLSAVKAFELEIYINVDFWFYISKDDYKVLDEKTANYGLTEIKED